MNEYLLISLPMPYAEPIVKGDIRFSYIIFELPHFRLPVLRGGQDIPN